MGSYPSSSYEKPGSMSRDMHAYCLVLSENSAGSFRVMYAAVEQIEALV